IGRPIDSYPAPGSLQLVPIITPHIGGSAANTWIALQTLGVSARVAGKVGRDGLCAFVKEVLKAHGGETTGEVGDATRPDSATMVMVRSDAERAFLHCTGANATYTIEDFDFSLLEGATLLHIAGHGLLPQFDGAQCAKVLAAARERGIKTCLDTAGAPDAVW